MKAHANYAMTIEQCFTIGTLIRVLRDRSKV